MVVIKHMLPPSKAIPPLSSLQGIYCEFPFYQGQTKMDSSFSLFAFSAQASH